MVKWGGRASALVCPQCGSMAFSNFQCVTCCREMLTDGRISLTDFSQLCPTEGLNVEEVHKHPTGWAEPQHPRDNGSNYDRLREQELYAGKLVCELAVLRAQLSVAHEKLDLLELMCVRLIGLSGDDGRRA